MATKSYPLYPTVEERAELDGICDRERRILSNVIRNILEDVVHGQINIDGVEDDRVDRKPCGVRLTDEFKAELDAFRSTRDNISMDRIMHRALKVLAARRAGKEQNQ